MRVAKCPMIARAMGKVRKSFYAVRVGRKTGVFDTWEDCKEQVDKFPGARYKGFSTYEEAEEFVCSVVKINSTVRGKYTGNFASRRESSRAAIGRSQSGVCGALSAQVTIPQLPLSDVPVVYCDGSCFNNGRTGARAGIGVYWGEDSPMNISEKLAGSQTNQRAEIVSACRALESAIEQGYKKVEVRTDSSYTIMAITEWMSKWKTNGWLTYSGEDVKNKEDFMRLEKLCQQIDVQWTHVRGHCGQLGNEAADVLAKEGSKKL